MTSALVIVAIAYAVVNAMNDGGALVSMAGQNGGTRPWLALCCLSVALVLVPLVFGAPVARTLVDRLVDFEGRSPTTLISAILSALVVVGLSAWRGLPTSLTLATVGAFVGAGISGAAPIDLSEARRVLVFALLAPVVGAVSAWVMLAVLTRVGLGVASTIGRRRVRQASFIALAAAYAANDGQKVIAVAIVALSLDSSMAISPPLWLLGALGGIFLVAALIGSRGSTALGSGGVLAARHDQAVASELSASAAVAISGSLGAPVSMSQTLAGSLAGGGSFVAVGKVRWGVGRRLVIAWATTFPAALVLAVVLGKLSLAVPE